jgi:hypothetical protein
MMDCRASSVAVGFCLKSQLYPSEAQVANSSILGKVILLVGTREGGEGYIQLRPLLSMRALFCLYKRAGVTDALCNSRCYKTVGMFTVW